MVQPFVLPPTQHNISRRSIDPDALKVLYRLQQSGHVAYLVGGSVRDLLLDRRPKDFDIGTSAHPYQVKRLFRNCWIVGRRFRLAHVKFGQKTVEVATFRRLVAEGTDGGHSVPAEIARSSKTEFWRTTPDGTLVTEPTLPAGPVQGRHDHLIHRDNTFGTPEEDAFRRDFTINALFYDPARRSVIDYVNGLDDLRAGLIRAIGDPDVRFREDPVRMFRAIALASRLNFRIDTPICEAIARHHHEIGRSAAPRLLEEYYKVLRAGASERTFRGLTEAGLVEHVSPELPRRATETLWQSLAALDAYRNRFDSTPEAMTNAILLGSLLVPLGLFDRQPPRHIDEEVDGAERAVTFGRLPLARRDVERLRQILALQRRLLEINASPRAQRALMQRGAFREALVWIEIHGGAPEAVVHWHALLNVASMAPVHVTSGAPEQWLREGRRRRRRRRRR